jgi:creatinine amidohydrolase/Fe(II)-dependent formamide hydrolase-like protein
VYFNYDEITDPSGIVGDGTEATAEKGKVWFDYIVDGAAGFVEWSKTISWKV